MNYGFIKSKLDGTEYIFKPSKSLELPSEYSYKKYLPNVLNQGFKPICVPCSLSCNINWNLNLNDGTKNDNNVDLESIYDSRTDEGDNGMSFKDALHFVRHEGVNTDKGLYKINQYAIVGSIIALKYAILMNGPCIGGLPVYETDSSEFWLDKGELQGGHAVAIIGYNEEGFIIRNSWGKDYGIDGYDIVPYDQFDKFYEMWTMY